MTKTASYLLVAALLLLGVSVGEAHSRTRVVHFHDGNLDDVLALGQLLYEPSVDVVGICAGGTGFAASADGVETSLRVLETVAALADSNGDQTFAAYVRGIPVARGSDTPLSSMVNLQAAILNVTAPPIRFLTQQLWFTRDVFFPSKGSLAQSALNCTQLLESALNGGGGGSSWNNGQRVTVLSTGTDTDMAIALQENPSVKHNIRRTWRMAGAISAPGNLFSFPDNTLAEFNVYTDPIATEVVLRALTVFLMPIDATNDVPITRDFKAQLALVAGDSLFAGWYNTLLDIVIGAFSEPVFYNDFHALGGGYYRWDQLCAQALIDGRCTSMDALPLSVDTTEGPFNPSGNLRKDYSIYKQEIVCAGIDPVQSDADFFDWIVDAGTLPAAYPKIGARAVTAVPAMVMKPLVRSCPASA